MSELNIRKKPDLALSSFRIKNFKAIRDSKTIRFTPLTVFIGNNGAGKSSLVEGLETLKAVAADGLDKAMQRWHGFEYICNQAAPHRLRKTAEGTEYQSNPMSFEIKGIARFGYGANTGHRSFSGVSEITAGPGANEVFFLKEELRQENPGGAPRVVSRLTNGIIDDRTGAANPIRQRLSSDESVLYAETSLLLWQFVRLNPETMGDPKPLHRVAGYLPLATDGSNLADYLLEIQRRDPEIIKGIIETLQVVLPYVDELEPTITSEVGRNVYLQLTEQNFRLPGWLFSTGTLRVVALLALFRHPEPPPLIVIEELENGLDPRSIALIVEEIRELITSGKSQVIVTSHSPYLLDLLPLSSLVFVERIDRQPAFFRPCDDAKIQAWSDTFAPGRLYSMGRFRHSK